MSEAPTPVSEFERKDYPGMVTPTELRNLALGLENSNHAAEVIARRYHASFAMQRALADFVEETRDTYPFESLPTARAALSLATGKEG